MRSGRRVSCAYGQKLYSTRVRYACGSQGFRTSKSRGSLGRDRPVVDHAPGDERVEITLVAISLDMTDRLYEEALNVALKGVMPWARPRAVEGLIRKE